MRIQVRGRIKDLLLRKRPDGSPMLTPEEADALYKKGLNCNSVFSFTMETEEPKGT